MKMYSYQIFKIFLSNYIMIIKYNNIFVNNGNFISTSNSSFQPSVDYKSDDNLYTLILHDPNAVKGNRIHWLVINIKGNDIKNGEHIYPYVGPAPPKGSGIHNYIFLVFKQENILKLNKNDFTFDKRYTSMPRLYGLLNINKEPMYKNFFKSQNRYEYITVFNVIICIIILVILYILTKKLIY
jgi:hypothetical protein